MKTTNGGKEWLMELETWMRSQQDGDNSERLRRLQRNLNQARLQELTPRQRQFLALYYDEGMGMAQIAAATGVNCSTVSRTIARAKRRLQRSLRYSL